ncbi:MAG: XRE family transcriptional regulator [Clostridia bacterium]|nr:XRE family transcriptional regulator [Clostridia bacterium]
MKIDLQRFARNLRNARNAQGLTQRELGERIGFSEKTVSKWECGAALPDVGTLFSIAELLRVNAETLLSDGKRYFLGIDGGGTKTDLALADTGGTILRTHRTSACNPVDIGIENATVILREAIFEICRGIRLSEVTMFAGIAGGTSGKTREQLHAFFSELGFAQFENDSDNQNIIAAGLGTRDGMTVILGTGFCIYTQRSGVRKRISGWGYLLDDGGSGYNLGRDALHAYFAAYDGTGEKTLLAEEIDRIYAGGADALIAYAYSAGKRAVASFAPAVFAACARGDAVARAILERNVHVAADLIGRAAATLTCEPIPVVLAGGLTGVPQMMDALCDRLRKSGSYQLGILQCEPVQGALMLARRLGGVGDE